VFNVKFENSYFTKNIFLGIDIWHYSSSKHRHCLFSCLEWLSNSKQRKSVPSFISLKIVKKSGIWLVTTSTLLVQVLPWWTHKELSTAQLRFQTFTRRIVSLLHIWADLEDEAQPSIQWVIWKLLSLGKTIRNQNQIWARKRLPILISRASRVMMKIRMMANQNKDENNFNFLSKLTKNYWNDLAV